MLTFVPFEYLVEDLAKGVHNLATGALKIALSNTAPNAATNHVLADITEIGTGNGYNAGGIALTTVSCVQTAGLLKLIVSDTSLVASGGNIGPARYLILYNNTPAGKNLLGYYDKGAAFTLNDTDELDIDADDTAGVLQIGF